MQYCPLCRSRLMGTESDRLHWNEALAAAPAAEKARALRAATVTKAAPAAAPPGRFLRTDPDDADGYRFSDPDGVSRGGFTCIEFIITIAGFFLVGLAVLRLTACSQAPATTDVETPAPRFKMESLDHSNWCWIHDTKTDRDFLGASEYKSGTAIIEVRPRDEAAVR